MYTSSTYKINKWFTHLNKTIFNNELPKFNKIDIKLRYKVHAHCIYFSKAKGLVHLEINPRFKDFETFLNVLGHEMVHMYQFLNGDTGNHNKLFYSFRPLFEANNMRLARLI